MRPVSLSLLIVFTSTFQTSLAAGKAPRAKTIGRSLKEGLLVSPTRAPKLKVPLPAVPDQCAKLPTNGTWVAFAGAVPVRLQLGGSMVPFGKVQMPAATLWRKHSKKKCWARNDLFLRPRGKATFTLRAVGKKPAKGHLNVGGKKLKIWLGHDYKGAQLNLSMGDDSVGEYTHSNDVDWVLPLPEGMSDEDGMIAPSCIGEAKSRLELQALRADGAIWFWLRCESKARSERALLRYDPAKRDLQLLYDEMRWAFQHCGGCDMCEFDISQTIRRSWLDGGHALVYRDDAMIGTGANTCEAHCGDVCDNKNRRACLKRCERNARREVIRMDRRCKRIKRKKRRWELIREDEETEQTTRAVLRRLK